MLRTADLQREGHLVEKTVERDMTCELRVGEQHD